MVRLNIGHPGKRELQINQRFHGTDSKMLFVIYLKFQSNWHPVFLSAKYGNPKSGACLLGVSASGKTQEAVRRTLGCGHPDCSLSSWRERSPGEPASLEEPWP